ncbi:hypothetical protein CQA53_00145 [Helicobacter didelphidarum]|uniref:Sialidase domain-containing protein n=1 Tax=Helicobacter didelphidarum TaxID=2040648 RepID=A0A3D8IQB9_9HELI|nr:hypothetical protein [Helicobacter didelphidarum]RDU67478.1 hypothetical protein CQA53_00145 [Helicobacter didelphidarum]
MKILDFLFYLFLCLIVGIALFVYDLHSDLYFPATFIDDSVSYEVYEKDILEVPFEHIQSVDITKLNESNYLISCFEGDTQKDSNLYGILFSPNKYSIQTYDNKWQNIAVNTEVWGNLRILATQDMLLSKIKQKIYSFSAPILQQDKETLYLFLNARNLAHLATSRIHIFRTNLHDVLKYLQDSHITHSSLKELQMIKEENKPPEFDFYGRVLLGSLANLNYFLSTKILEVYRDIYNENFILPLYAKFYEYINFFGIFDSNFKLQEVIKPHNNSHLYKPIIAKVPQGHISEMNKYTSTMNNSRSCLALYHNAQIHKEHSANLHFQTCEINNGIFEFQPLKISHNIENIGDLSLATFGKYVILVYTNVTHSMLQLAIWNGEDFITIQQIEKNQKSEFISPNIIVHGLHAYIVYADKQQQKVMVVTLNEQYIDNLMSSHNMR